MLQCDQNIQTLPLSIYPKDLLPKSSLGFLGLFFVLFFLINSLKAFGLKFSGQWKPALSIKLILHTLPPPIFPLTRE